MCFSPECYEAEAIVKALNKLTNALLSVDLRNHKHYSYVEEEIMLFNLMTVKKNPSLYVDLSVNRVYFGKKNKTHKQKTPHYSHLPPQD